MSARKLWLPLFVTLTSCASVEFPDVRACTVAGIIMAGADCDYSGHAEPSSMGMQDFISWLEDSNALCLSSKDYLKQKVAVEQACVKLGGACSFEVKQAVKEMDSRLNNIVKKGQKNK